MAYFGLMFRGGRVQWPFLLAGHGYELTQHDTYTFTTTDIPINTDTATVTRTYPIAYASGVTPDVSASSHDVGWIASAAPTSGHEQTQIDISLSRRIPLTNPQTGTVSLTFPSGASSYTYPSNPVTFPTAYNSSITPTPVIVAQTNHPDFIAQASSITTTGYDLTIYYRPNLSSGSVGTPSPNQSGDNSDASTGMYDLSDTTPASTTPLPTGGVNGSPSTGNNSDGTDTGAASRSPNTGTQSQDHTHLEHDVGGQTGGESVGHDHAMDHTHPHNASGGNHTHPEGAHDHNTADHVHRLNNHHHDLSNHTHPFTGATTLTGGSQALTIVWQSFGSRAAPAVSKLLTWQAVGVQAS